MVARLACDTVWHVATRTNGKGAFGRRKVADNKIGARFPALIGLVVGVVVLALLLYVSRDSLAAFQLGKEQASG
jgi:ketosteroid isomerase-like protein